MPCAVHPRATTLMSTEKRYGWMWLQALELSDEAERVKRRFLRYLGPGTDAVTWEPPVDIHETPDGFLLVFAMPGVAPEDVEIQLERTALTVSARRPPRATHRDALIRRLEIPYGRFVRQITLSGSALRIEDTRCLNGCLEVRLARAQGAQ
jgi:HSP20 family protein